MRIAVAALVFVSVASVADGNADTTVYKCTQASGAVLYADYPCKGSVIVDIQRGAADPDATRRLERARAELDQAAARREANEEIAAIRRQELSQQRREAEAAQRLAEFASYPPDPTYGAAYVFNRPFVKRRTNQRNIHRRVEHHRMVPEARVPAVIHRPNRPG